LKLKGKISIVSIVCIIFLMLCNFSIVTPPITTASTVLSNSNDSQLTLTKNEQETPSHYAIIIGIEQYEHDITPRRTTIDETAFAAYTKLKTGKNWHADNIKLLLNENATKNNIKKTILNWLNPIETKDDIILFYFIGYTEKIPISTLFKGNTISYCYDSTDSNDIDDKITDKELDGWFDSLQSRHISIILDTSYAKNMHALPQLGRTILQATGTLFQTVNPTDNSLPHTVFSHFIINGLNGHADNNNDGEISLLELFSYTDIHSFQYSFQRFINCIKQLDFRFHPQLPSLSNRHISDICFFKLPFGWKQLTDNGFGKQSNYATRGTTIFKGELYIGTQNNLLPQHPITEEQILTISSATLIPDLYDFFGELSTIPSRIVMHLMTFVSQGCEIWKYNYSTDSLVKVIGKKSQSGIPAGFGSHFNAAAAVMHVFKNQLYVGTWNTPLGTMKSLERKGCEIWRTSDGFDWEQVVGHNAPFTPGGFGNPDNTGAWSIETFNDYLYVGTMNWDFSETGGCEVWRSNDGIHWEQVVNQGFRPFMNISISDKEAINTYAWNMEEYHGHLYMGTFNSRVWLRNGRGTGCQLWRTANGIDWEKVLLPDGLNDGIYKDGFGEEENYGIRRMVVYNDELYCGIASSFFHNHGCEIWKYDGTHWTPIISDELPGVTKHDKCYDGFGNNMNKYVWSMIVTNDNKLWVGTGNGQVYLPFIFKGEKNRRYFTTHTEGCEIWCYDGIMWQPVIKNDIGLKPNGLGDSTNLGARSMIEYPKNSGNLVVGTFKLFNSVPGSSREGCELWMRYMIK